jgi:glutaredoxin
MLKVALPWIAAALVAVPSLLAAQQTIYKWVDKDGKTVFSDTPPPKEITTSTQKRVGGGYTENIQLPYATQIAMQKNPVTLYTAGDCGALCDQGRSLLSKRGIPYSERDGSTDPAAAEAVQKAVGSFIVPVLMVGESALKGFDESIWQSSLDTAGYPRTALPNQPNPRATPPKKAAPPAPPPPAPAAEGEAPPEAPAEQPK